MNNQSQNIEFNLEMLSKMMPGIFLWKKNIDSIYTEINKNCAELFGINKKKDISGLTDYEIPCKISEFANLFQQQDNQVIKTGEPLKILEMHICANDQWKVMLNTKNPLRDKNNMIIGTFAYCIDITNQIGEIQNLLSSIKNDPFSKTKSLQGSYILHRGNVGSNLSRRQMDCLFYILRGKTIKETANILQLSIRTVGHYLEAIKNKFSCHSKSELIDIAISKGFMNVIPNCLFNQCAPRSIIQK